MEEGKEEDRGEKRKEEKDEGRRRRGKWNLIIKK